MHKKLFISLILCCILSGCTLSKEEVSLLNGEQQFIIEENASLRIQIEDKEYAQALKKLWNKTYPKHKDCLHIEETTQSTTPYDIVWTKDSQVEKNVNHLYPIMEVQDTIEVMIPSLLQRNKDYFLPMEGRGLVLIYNEETLKKRHGTEADLYHFEDMKHLGDHAYYHNRKEDYVNPFLFTPDDIDAKEWIQSDILYDNLARYRRLDDELQLIDDQIEMETFYLSGDYVCGLIMNDGEYMNSTLYKKGKLHFIKMPDYEGVSYAPIIDTYGFAIEKQTLYPGAASAFLQLVRSEEGMKRYIETTTKTPIIAKESLDELFIFDHTRKELIQVMSDSQLRDDRTNVYINKTTFYANIQNSLYTSEANASVKKRLKKDIQI